jgi:acyl-coenzyme A thioesterase PaaI-like protein
MRGSPSFVHAGAVAAVLDSACGYATFSMMPLEAAMLTASYTINLLALAAGERFRMTGTVVRAGWTLVCRGDAFAGDATTSFAVTQATLTARYDRPGNPAPTPARRPGSPAAPARLAGPWPAGWGMALVISSVTRAISNSRARLGMGGREFAGAQDPR